MQILSVHFKNINSLAGEWSLDFTDEAYRDGIFLLTGPVGSGKTTIFDAITLALFGCTARVDVSQSDCPVMTTGTGISMSEVVFKAQGRRYRSRWTQNRARENAEGRLQKAELVLEDADTGVDLFPKHGQKEVKKAVEQIVGSTFEQFTRTTLLAQGKFNDFLTADENGRAAILEKVAGTKRYSDAGRCIHETCAEKSNAVENLKTRLGEHIVYSAEVRAAKEAEEQVLGRETTAGQAKVDELGRWLAWIQEGEDLEKKRESLGSEGEILRAHEKSFAGKAGRLAEAEKAAALDSDFAALQAARQAAEESCRELERRRQAQIRAEQALPEAEEKASAKTIELEAAKKVFEQGLSLVKKARAAQEEWNLRQKDASNAEAALGGTKIALDSARKDLAAKINKATDAKMLADCLSPEGGVQAVPPELARNRFVRNRAEKDMLAQELQPLVAAAGRARAEFERAEADRKTAEADFQSREPMLQKAVDDAQKLKDKALAFRSLAEHRAKLHDGDTCPLCGGVFHTDALPEEEDFETVLNNAKTALQEAQNHVSDAAAAARAKLEEAGQEEKLAASKKERLEVLARVCAADLAGAKADAEQMAANVSEAKTRLDSAQTAFQQSELKKRAADEAVRKAEADFRSFGMPDPSARDDELRREYERVQALCRAAENSLSMAKTALENAKTEYRLASGKSEHASAERNTAETSFADALAKAGFADETAWKSAQWKDAEFQAARAERESVREEKARLDGARRALEADEAAHRANPYATERSREDVEAEKSEVDRDLREKNQRLGAVRSELRLDQERRDGQNLLRQELDAAIEEESRWKQLDAMLGGIDGYRFRNYANGLTFRRLLAHANPHLLRMSGGRYSMRWMPPAEASGRSEQFGLLPDILDAEADGADRTVRNVSGGETFQVSLALALGLSEMSRNAERMENLFLDEGFGSLEGEALERAIDTLEHVQGAGCLLGVISHVPAVADRIHTQIVASKDGFGHSTLKGPGVTRLASAPVETGKTKSKTRKKKKDPETNEEPGL